MHRDNGRLSRTVEESPATVRGSGQGGIPDSLLPRQDRTGPYLRSGELVKGLVPQAKKIPHTFQFWNNS